MDYDFQRASMLKRAPAWLLDVILLATLITGFMVGWSTIFKVIPYVEKVVSIQQRYEAEYGGQLDIPLDEYEKLTEEERKQLDKANTEITKAMDQDAELIFAYEKAISNAFSVISLSFLCAYLILEFLIPLWLKNGQTIGKKCFGVALMRKDGIKVTPFMMFTRSILGKCSVEAMFPVMLFVVMGGNGLIVLICLAFFLAQIIIPLATRNKTAIHDLMACTVAVDLGSQMIFDSVEAMDEYHEKIRVDKAFEDQE